MSPTRDCKFLLRDYPCSPSYRASHALLGFPASLTFRRILKKGAPLVMPAPSIVMLRATPPIPSCPATNSVEPQHPRHPFSKHAPMESFEPLRSQSRCLNVHPRSSGYRAWVKSFPAASKPNYLGLLNSDTDLIYRPTQPFHSRGLHHQSTVEGPSTIRSTYPRI